LVQGTEYPHKISSVKLGELTDGPIKAILLSGKNASRWEKIGYRVWGEI
jgi:hypothetical protein